MHECLVGLVETFLHKAVVSYAWNILILHTVGVSALITTQKDILEGLDITNCSIDTALLMSVANYLIALAGRQDYC